MIPFDIFSLDNSRGVNEKSEKSLLVSKIFDLGQSYLYDSGPSRDAASFCLSSLLTRPDMDNNLMMDYMKETCNFVEMWSMKGDAASSELNADYFKLVGSMNCIALVFKKGHRANLLNCAREILKHCLLLTEQANQTVIRKLCTKIFQRIGMAFLPPRVASWRYQRGFRSLQLNISDSTISTRDDRVDQNSTIHNDLRGTSSSVEEDEVMDDVDEDYVDAVDDSDGVLRYQTMFEDVDEDDFVSYSHVAVFKGAL